jgi:hypothetical protein
MAIEERGIVEAIIFSSDSALGLKDIQKAMPDMTPTSWMKLYPN